MIEADAAESQPLSWFLSWRTIVETWHRSEKSLEDLPSGWAESCESKLSLGKGRWWFPGPYWFNINTQNINKYHVICGGCSRMHQGSVPHCGYFHLSFTCSGKCSSSPFTLQPLSACAVRQQSSQGSTAHQAACRSYAIENLCPWDGGSLLWTFWILPSLFLSFQSCPCPLRKSLLWI